MSQITKETLVNRIHAVLTAEISAFLNQPSPEEQAHAAEIDSVRQQAANAGNPIVASALKQAVKELEAKRPDGSAARRQEAALAVLIVTNGLRLPLQIKGSAPVEVKAAKAAKTGGGKRMTRATMNQLMETVLNAFPANGQAIAISELAEKIKSGVNDTRSAILRLKREGKVAPNGVHGRGGAWVRK